MALYTKEIRYFVDILYCTALKNGSVQLLLSY